MEMQKTAAKVIKNCVNGLAMKKIMTEKGWSKNEAQYAVIEFLTCGKNVSFHDFMKNFSLKQITVH
jgi:hypothetical protein